MEVIFIATVLQMVIVVILLAIVFIAGKTVTHQRKRNHLFAKKSKEKRQEAKAVILNVEQTGLYLNQRIQVRLEMQVLPGKGRNFITEITELVAETDIAFLKKGGLVSVQYDPANPKAVELIKAA